MRKRTGPKPKPDALRRAPDFLFKLPGALGEKLDRLASAKTGGSKAAMLRLLIAQAPDPSSEGGTTPGQRSRLVRAGTMGEKRARRLARSESLLRDAA